MWSLMRLLYVVDPRDADKIRWSVSHLPNESLFNLMKHRRPVWSRRYRVLSAEKSPVARVWTSLHDRQARKKEEPGVMPGSQSQIPCYG